MRNSSTTPAMFLLIEEIKDYSTKIFLVTFFVKPCWYKYKYWYNESGWPKRSFFELFGPDLVCNYLSYAPREKLTSWEGPLLSLWWKWQMSTMVPHGFLPNWSTIKSTVGTVLQEKCLQPLSYCRSVCHQQLLAFPSLQSLDFCLLGSPRSAPMGKPTFLPSMVPQI